MKVRSPSFIAISICLALQSTLVQAEKWEFNASALGVSDQDVALFNQGGQLPGTYRVGVLLNGELVDLRDVTFRLEKDAAGKNVLSPCLDRVQLSRYGIKTDDYAELAAGADGCAELSAIPGASAEFSFSGQQLLLSIPQIALRPELTGIAPQEMWDDGVPAFLMNYQASVNRSENRVGTGNRVESGYLQLEPGANLGPWRLRNSVTWESKRGQSRGWQSAYTYLERGLYKMKSRLTLGERFTPSDVFDSVPFRGVMLGADGNMVPSNMRSFVPIIRGIARTQARVEVSQKGYTIYRTTVAPGPFQLESLPVFGSGGDLMVTVIEADGNNQVFIAPYQTPAIALHKGYLDYNLMAGKYRSSYAGVTRANVAQAVVMYGLPWNLTLYGGWQGATHYQALSAGLGISLGRWGSLSLDATRERGQLYEHNAEGGGTRRLRYSKLIDATNTTLALSSYQYSSSGYMALSDVLDSYRQNSGTSNTNRRKSRNALTLSQSLGNAGSLSLGGYQDRYRSSQQDTTGLSASYSVGIHGVSLSLSWSQNCSGGRNDQLVSAVVSMPLSRWMGGNTRASGQITSPVHGSSTEQLGLSGDSYDHQLSWNVMQWHQSGMGDHNSSALQLGWRGTYGQLDGSYSYSPSYRQAELDASGGLLITRDGLVAGQTLDDTVVLAEAPGASGVPVGGMTGVKTDFRGYAVLGGQQPYQKSVVSLDPTWLPNDVEVTQTDVTVVPTGGAVIPAAFTTSLGGRALVTLTRPDGRPVPFGTLVTLLEKNLSTTSVADESGLVYLSGLPTTGQLQAKWGASAEQQCRADYHLPDKVGPAGVYTVTVACH
ncbi:fimbria/pilus outer membrane usher protein [Lonsdalea quercina]|uniref:fimbria/pilus outer membrane usher protein n=1 Tax=Lonsdalea quercina TaxID=71657 RepID=UPI003974C5F4